MRTEKVMKEIISLAESYYPPENDDDNLKQVSFIFDLMQKVFEYREEFDKDIKEEIEQTIKKIQTEEPESHSLFNNMLGCDWITKANELTIEKQ